MGIVSSLFVHVVINVCWQCRLYMETGGSRNNPPVSSPDSGFLSTPDATSTPQSPLVDKQKQVTNFEVNVKRTIKDKKSRNVSKTRSHRLSEILSPAEEEIIRITMARGYVTPASIRSKAFLRSAKPRPPIRGVTVPNVIQRFPPNVEQYLSSPAANYRTRGMRI